MHRWKFKQTALLNIINVNSSTGVLKVARFALNSHKCSMGFKILLLDNTWVKQII